VEEKDLGDIDEGDLFFLFSFGHLVWVERKTIREGRRGSCRFLRYVGKLVFVEGNIGGDNDFVVGWIPETIGLGARFVSHKDHWKALGVKLLSFVVVYPCAVRFSFGDLCLLNGKFDSRTCHIIRLPLIVGR